MKEKETVTLDDLKARVPTVTAKQLADVLGMTTTNIFLMERDGRFPKSVNLTGAKRPTRRWFKKDIERFLQDRAARSGYEAFHPEYLD